jgi:hypothetical protein
MMCRVPDFQNDSAQADLNLVAWMFAMRSSSWTPIVPGGDDETVYLVAGDFGRLGRAWREADYEATDPETVIRDLLTGQYNNPVRVIAFNTAEHWLEDVPKTLLANCVAAAISRCANCPMRSLISWKSTETRISGSCPFDWSNSDSHFASYPSFVPPFMNLTTPFSVLLATGRQGRRST